MTAKNSKESKYPWPLTKQRRKFFVPKLDVEGTRLEGLKAAIPYCLYGKPRAEIVVYKGMLGVIFWLQSYRVPQSPVECAEPE